MQISREPALSLDSIADLWSQELRGSTLEKSSTELLSELLLAFRTKEFTLARGQNALRDPLGKWREFGKNVRALDDTALIQTLKLTREEFLRWVDYKGVERPTFWVGEDDLGEANPASTESQSVAAAAGSARSLRHAGGKPPQYDWEEVKLFVFKTLDELGDFVLPENQYDRWRSQADLKRLVKDHLKKLYEKANPEAVDAEDRLPAESTLKARIGPMVEKWRAGQAGN